MALLSIPEASKWATKFLEKDVSPTNISYLVQYGKVAKHGQNGTTRVDIEDLKQYYESWRGQRQTAWQTRLGGDLNWALSFDHLREKDTTKHVHRLHPYKGKFIPQLVEYFLDQHTDEFKRQVYFKSGDIVLDPFLSSGTTIIQSLEMGLHAVGIDVSAFNCMIAGCKAARYDKNYLRASVKNMLDSLARFERDHAITEFENSLMAELAKFNTEHFPGPDFRYKISHGQIDENKYTTEKAKQFLPIYQKLVKKYNVKLCQNKSATFLDIWYLDNVRQEIDYVFQVIRREPDVKMRKILALILSRTIRSCRATTHSDLATLKQPQLETYYCFKHKKICKPLFSIRKMLSRYGYDTLQRIAQFDALRQPAYYSVIAGDGITVNIYDEVNKQNPAFAKLLKHQSLAGIFCSPPYVGQIDYHEQHAYAYDLLGFERKDDLEIGPLYGGQGIEARKAYVEGISDVLSNCKPYLKKDANVFLVANDKYNLYPEIAARANMKIVNRYKRPVLNRTERDRNPYSETIFHLKGQNT
ncbi:MAG: DNA methyltransferase [Candidatus Saccharimonadales bacterium]